LNGKKERPTNFLQQCLCLFPQVMQNKRGRQIECNLFLFWIAPLSVNGRIEQAYKGHPWIIFQGISMAHDVLNFKNSINQDIFFLDKQYKLRI
jgi:hypothetical protein